MCTRVHTAKECADRKWRLASSACHQQGTCWPACNAAARAPRVQGPATAPPAALNTRLLLLRGDLAVQLLPPHHQLLQALLALRQRCCQHLFRG